MSTLLGAVLLSVIAVPTFAQQITGTPGSPSATSSIDGQQLPPPPQKFGGKIAPRVRQTLLLI